jgi:hypothetical protein
MSEVTTRVCAFRLDGEGFVFATMKDGARFELDDAKEAVEATREVAGHVRRPVLVDMRRIQSESREARAYFGSADVARYFSAVALLVSSPLSRMIANFFLRVSSHPLPTRLFDDERSAREWLRGFVP